MPSSTNDRPEVVLGNLGTYLDTSCLSAEQRQRAWCLTAVRILYPATTSEMSLRLAGWLYNSPPARHYKNRVGPRPVVPLPRFVEVWQRIADETPAPRDPVCAELGIGIRTYDRYLQSARDAGLTGEVVSR